MREVFSFGDIHGQYDLYDAIINDCLAIDPECMIVYLGDGCDRGPHGYRIMRELLDNPQVVYLKGNHEDMFVEAAHFICGYYADTDEHYNFLHSKKIMEQALDLLTPAPVAFATNLYFANGGLDTMVDWLIDGADEDFVDKIENLPLTFSYENIDFCHSGITYDIFSRVYEAEYQNKPELLFQHSTDKPDILWNRRLLPIGWETGRICVFGHTPTITLPQGIYGRDTSLKHSRPCAWQDKMGAKDKRGGWKIDMDTGAVWSNRAYVLNCLTMIVYGYEDIVDAEENHIISLVEKYKII